MSKQVVSPEEQEQMAEMVRGNYTYREVAEKFGRTVDEVSILMSAIGVCRKRLRERRNDVFQMVEAGLPTTEIVRRTGYSPGHLEQVITRQKHIHKSRTKKKRA